MIVGYGVEGLTDAPIAEKLIRLIGRQPRPLSDSGGSGTLDQKILKWNSASLRIPILVLRDWDERDQVECAPALVQQVLGGALKSNQLVVRIPVRSIESWLLADEVAFKSFFGTTGLPGQPDQEPNPKHAVVAACRRSRKPAIKKAVVPSDGSGRAVGPLYVGTIIEFAASHWDARRAEENSPSLQRAINRLEVLNRAWTR